MNFTGKLDRLRNEKGQISIESIMGAIVFLFGLYIFVIIYDPIANSLLFPILDNTEKITYGPEAKLIILIIPLIIAIMGIISIVRGFSRPQPPPYYQ